MAFQPEQLPSHDTSMQMQATKLFCENAHENKVFQDQHETKQHKYFTDTQKGQERLLYCYENIHLAGM